MAEKVRIELGGKTCRMELLRDRAPELCARFEQCLPLRSFAAHAKFAGEELFFMVPFLAPAENLVSAVAPGDVGYYPDRETVCVFYGDIVPFGQVGVFGRIVEGLEGLRELGPRLWRGPALSVRVTSETDRSLPGEGLPTPPPALGAIWDAPPGELAALGRERRPPSSDMPKRLYANFDCYWLAGVLYVMRESLESGAVGPEPAATMIRRFVGLAATRLGTWGFADASARLRAAAASGAIQPDRAALTRVTADLIVYLNRLQSWIDATVPWATLDTIAPLEAPRPSTEEA
jgi:hypothetical protein